MVRRRRYSTKRRKRVKRRIRRPLSLGFPGTYRTKLKYVDDRQLQLNVGNGYLQTYQYRLNSVYDPDLTGTGGQPTYYDEFTQMYQRSRVIGCHVKFTIVNLHTTYPLNFSVQSSSDSSIVLSGPNLMAQSGGSSVRTVSSEGSNNMTTFKKYYPCHKVNGVTKTALMSSNIYSSNTGNLGTGANPNQDCIVNIQVTNLDQEAYFILRAELTYDVRFESKRPISGS